LATIRDVARAAGVSIATVSRVFNGSSRVGEQTATRVWSAAGELDYWPNSAARSLTTQCSHALGVLLPDLHGEFFSEVIRGIDQTARREKFQVLISSSHADADELVAAARSMHGRVDGLIIMASDTETAGAVDRISHMFPVTLLNPCQETVCCDMVSLANCAGAQRVVAHLLGLGHHHIAIITGPEGNIDAEERLRGYRQALQDAGILPSAELQIRGDFTEHSGHQAARQLLSITPRPTAVFAANDCMAVGLLSALHEAGVEVPDEIAVAGFDDIATARYLRPPLTTVKIDTFKLGQRAVQLLLAGLASGQPSAGRRETLPATLVIRQSCGSTRQREQLVS
jgi:LacI family transcriptional regulator